MSPKEGGLDFLSQNSGLLTLISAEASHMIEDKLLTSTLQTFGLKLLTRISQSEMCEALGLLGQKRMAARLGISYEAFRWRVSKGRLPKPAGKLRRRAYYTAEQVVALEMREARTINEETHSTQGGSS